MKDACQFMLIKGLNKVGLFLMCKECENVKKCELMKIVREIIKECKGFKNDS